MTVLVLTVGSVSAPSTLATPTNLVVTPNSDGSANLLTCDSVTNADTYVWEKELDLGGVWVALATTASPTFNDAGISAGRHRRYRVQASDSTGTYVTSAFATSGDIFTALPSNTWPVLRESIIPGAPAAGGMQSEWGFTAGVNGFILIVNTTTNTKPGVFAAVSGRTRTWTCTIRDALEITDSQVTALGGNASTPIVVLVSVSGSVSIGGEITIRRARLSVLFQCAPSPGFFLFRANVRIAASDVLLWHPQFVQGNAGSSPSLDNSDGVQVGASSFTGTPIERSGVANGSFTGATDEGGEYYSAGSELFCWQSIFPFPLSNAGRGERHACGLVFGEIPSSAYAARCITGDGDFRIPFLSRIGTLMLADGYSGNSAGQWANINPNNRANGGFGPNQVQRTNVVAHGFIQGPNTVQFEPIQISEYVSGGPSTFVSGSQLCVKDNWTVGSGWGTHGVSDSDQKTFCFEYNGGPFGSGSPTSGANAAFYTTTIITAAWAGNYTAMSRPTNSAEKRARVVLLNQTSGARPADRAAGYDATFLQQFVNEIDGVTSGVGRPQRVDRLLDIVGATGDGYPTVSSGSRDLFSGTHPLPADPDTLVTYGSRQLKKITAWAIEENNRWSLVVQPSLID